MVESLRVEELSLGRSLDKAVAVCELAKKGHRCKVRQAAIDVRLPSVKFAIVARLLQFAKQSCGFVTRLCGKFSEPLAGNRRDDR